MSPPTPCQRCQLKYYHNQQACCRHWEAYPHDQRMLPIYWQQTTIQCLPVHIIMELFSFCILWLNIFPPKNCISMFLSLHHIQYAKTQKETDPTNSDTPFTALPYVWGPTVIFKVHISSSILTHPNHQTQTMDLLSNATIHHFTCWSPRTKG